MQEYEVCREIFNQCSNNQMRDVDFFELEIPDLDAYMKAEEPKALIEKEVLESGTVIYHTDTQGLLKRYSFTPI